MELSDDFGEDSVCNNSLLGLQRDGIIDVLILVVFVVVLSCILCNRTRSGVFMLIPKN